MTDLDRRSLLKALAAASAMGILPEAVTPGFAQSASGTGALKLADPKPFSFDLLKQQAQALAAQPYTAPMLPAHDVVSKLNYEEWGKITFNTDEALFAGGPGRFPVTFFHLGLFFAKSVDMLVVADGTSREIVYDQSMFNIPGSSPARQLPKGIGFAGFRVQEPRTGKLDWRKNDWAAFLGASYFRAIGELYQYGQSARGVAIDTAVADRPEEFPDFTKFYIETPTGDSDTITICALLDGPSVTGAYKFLMTRGAGVTIELDHTLHLRKDVERLGIAPLTTMYWYSESAKPTAVDWRPEVHDSDGLSLWTGSGERLWRALNNPDRTTASAFADQSPKGFGTMQRDRIFDHYVDGVYYNKRPSVWVEPQGDWGKGAVQLIEIPTDDEIHDNVVAMWVPAEPARAGNAYAFKYKQYWLAYEPFPPTLAKVTATRLGHGGQPGQPRPPGVRKFLVEFLGGPLEALPFGTTPEQVVSTSRGSFGPYKLTEAVADGVPGHWMTQFDLTVEGSDPVELRCFLKSGDKVLTETWLFQYHAF